MAKDLFLIIDTKTNGLPISWVEPPTNTLNWPRLIQIAWIVCDPMGQPLEKQAYTIKPMGFDIPKSVEEHLGISTEKAIETGTDPIIVLWGLADIIEKCTEVVGHNMILHRNVIAAEMVRFEIKHKLNERQKTCTKERTTSFCNLAGNNGLRWPKLYELYEMLFYEPMPEDLDILGETEALANCYFELKKAKVL